MHRLEDILGTCIATRLRKAAQVMKKIRKLLQMIGILLNQAMSNLKIKMMIILM